MLTQNLIGLAATTMDTSQGEGEVMLRRMSEQIGRIARDLARLSDTSLAVPAHCGPEDDDRPGVAVPGSWPAHLPQADLIRTVIRHRRKRDEFFDADLFADPAWDMLLDLLHARLRRDQVSVSSLAIAAAVPPTTALRWIATMTELGLLARESDPLDRRRIFITLTDRSMSALCAYFSALGPSVTGLI